MKNNITKEECNSLVASIQSTIDSRTTRVIKILNKETIDLYWEIGKLIFLEVKNKGWGKQVVNVLSLELRKKYPGSKGYSSSNLWRMRNFFESYQDNQKLAPLVREINWSCNILIFEKCKDLDERYFYLNMARNNAWSKRILMNQIEQKVYEKYLISQENFDISGSGQEKLKTSIVLKDEYTFDFADLGIDYSEHELEMQLIQNVREFLSELGSAFSFIGNQYRIEVGGKDYFIDLLLFHRQLKCLVAVELKIGEFTPEYAGKMQFYLAALDEQVRMLDENPSIGIIICKEKIRTVVEYALKYSSKPIGVSTYTISDTLPKDYEKMLPSPEKIAKKLQIFENL
jgi:predicted nuclease of restriction endonuclease-like (RecB) superfamily